MGYLKEFKESIDQPEQFWKRQAKKIHWFSSPESILSHDENDFYRWFKGGTMNTCHLALDIHVENGRGNQLALIYDSPVTDTQKHSPTANYWINIPFRWSFERSWC